MGKKVDAAQGSQQISGTGSKTHRDIGPTDQGHNMSRATAHVDTSDEMEVDTQSELNSTAHSIVEGNAPPLFARPPIANWASEVDDRDERASRKERKERKRAKATEAGKAASAAPLNDAKRQERIKKPCPNCGQTGHLKSECTQRASTEDSLDSRKRTASHISLQKETRNAKRVRKASANLLVDKLAGVSVEETTTSGTDGDQAGQTAERMPVHPHLWNKLVMFKPGALKQPGKGWPEDLEFILTQAFAELGESKGMDLTHTQVYRHAGSATWAIRCNHEELAAKLVGMELKIGNHTILLTKYRPSGPQRFFCGNTGLSFADHKTLSQALIDQYAKPVQGQVLLQVRYWRGIRMSSYMALFSKPPLAMGGQLKTRVHTPGGKDFVAIWHAADTDKPCDFCKGLHDEWQGQQCPQALTVPLEEAPGRLLALKDLAPADPERSGAPGQNE